MPKMFRWTRKRSLYSSQRWIRPSSQIESEYLMAQSVWTEKWDERLRDLWDRGYSSAMIAAQLTKEHPHAEFTRNMVLGRARRTKLAPRERPISISLAKHKLLTRKPEPVIKEGCRWIDTGVDPIEAMRSGRDPHCGKPKMQGKSYCEEHAKRALLATRPLSDEIRAKLEKEWS